MCFFVESRYPAFVFVKGHQKRHVGGSPKFRHTRQGSTLAGSTTCANSRLRPTRWHGSKRAALRDAALQCALPRGKSISNVGTNVAVCGSKPCTPGEAINCILLRLDAAILPLPRVLTFQIACVFGLSVCLRLAFCLLTCVVLCRFPLWLPGLWLVVPFQPSSPKHTACSDSEFTVL